MSDCEPLQGKRVQYPEYLDMDGFNFNDVDVASACKFYKKYRNGNGLQQLQKDFPELYEKVCNKIKGHYSAYSSFSSYDIWWNYNDWLFDYCFQDVIE